ncbi:MAG TPA: iron ABC transporter permease [Steroidobacteraceae bacterium]|nr:iron ABC transporter permease [Steroidobacteraceae bacterium]
MKPGRLLLLLALAALLSLALAISTGSTPLRLDTLMAALFEGHDSVVRDVILELRLPRALNAFSTGGLLALAGVLMQVLLRNPLADPYVLGISGGAAVSALAAMLLGFGGLIVDWAAGTGALGATLLVFALAHARGGWTPQRLLLNGVVVASGCTAIVSLMLALGDETRLRGMLFWLMGDLSFASFSPAALCLLAAVGGLAIAGARSLNVLARGEVESQALGLALSPARIALFCATAALTATAVTTAGGIGFIGLVTPHLVRLVAGANHRIVVPASILLGGTLLTLADTLARIAAAPRQLPVGALTALIGVPLFLILMRRERRITS